jgi:CheY-like chemotaxis protein
MINYQDHEENKTKRVMIVEDEALIALLFQRDLARRGYTIVGVFSSGEAALEFWAGGARADIVLMDIQLDGDLDGIQTAITLQAMASFYLIYMTGYGNEEIKSRAMETKPAAFFEKPVDPRELSAFLEKLLV